jgi:maltose/maltodextrin transport system substrate-binding protein
MIRGIKIDPTWMSRRSWGNKSFILVKVVLLYRIGSVAMTIRQGLRIFWLLFILLLIASCRASNPDDELSGRITLWHSWSAEETVILEEALAQFQEIHPSVRIISVALPQDRILEEFIEAGNDGLGPGLLIGRDGWIGELVNAGLIQPISPDKASATLFNSRNRALIQYQDQLFGFPLFLAPNALYYNRNLVTEPPELLDDLLVEADVGNQVAFVPRFEEAYWGIQAFGEGLFDEQDRFTLAESGFTEWLSWLDKAQHASGVILNVDNASLLELFTSGEVAYYVAGPETQSFLTSMMDEEDSFEFGVVPLPAGAQGPAGPLLPAETILLYAFSSPEQNRIANALAGFLVNQRQSIRFMRELDRVPANPLVNVDQRIYPIVNGFAQQARTAVVLPNEIPTDPLVVAGERAYASVLSGVLTPTEAVCRFGQEVAAFQDYTAAEVSLPEGCELPENGEDYGRR